MLSTARVQAEYEPRASTMLSTARVQAEYEPLASWLRLYSARTQRIFPQHGAARIDDRGTCFHDRPYALLVLSIVLAYGPLRETIKVTQENVKLKKSETILNVKNEKVEKANKAIKDVNKIVPISRFLNKVENREVVKPEPKSYSSQCLEANLRDIDKLSGDCQILLGYYAEDIYSYLRDLEIKFPISPTFMSELLINSKMRSILVDWLVEVHQQFALLPETLYVTVSILDRFLQRDDPWGVRRVTAVNRIGRMVRRVTAMNRIGRMVRRVTAGNRIGRVVRQVNVGNRIGRVVRRVIAGNRIGRMVMCGAVLPVTDASQRSVCSFYPPQIGGSGGLGLPPSGHEAREGDVWLVTLNPGGLNIEGGGEGYSMTGRFGDARALQMSFRYQGVMLELIEKTVQRKYLQLVGISALFVACKYEEICSPDVQDFVYISDSAYSKEQIFKMEQHMLMKLEFKLGRPVPLHFLRRFSRAADASSEQHAVAKYLMELCLVECDMCHYAPSMIAAAALYLSLSIINNPCMEPVWTKNIQHYSRYNVGEVEPVAKKLAAVVKKLDNSKLMAVKKKYSHSKYAKVSLRPELDSQALKSIAESRMENVVL
uniref:Cyclin B n=1 Tax=Timema monikensis TaxID=170555 RepID=A0A7R9HNY2_9NEOP|nr:unnamed protein product [Timema monikensis]